MRPRPELETRQCRVCGTPFRTAPVDPYWTCSLECENGQPEQPRPAFLAPESIRAMIDATSGQIFAVEFLKADGTLRLMVARTGSYSKRPNRNCVTVFDVERGGFRSVPYNRVLSLAITTASKVNAPAMDHHQSQRTASITADSFAGF